MSGDPEALSYATTEQIFEELKNRYDSFVVCTHKLLDDKSYQIIPMFWGSRVMCLGLVETLKYKARELEDPQRRGLMEP